MKNIKFISNVKDILNGSGFYFVNNRDEFIEFVENTYFAMDDISLHEGTFGYCREFNYSKDVFEESIKEYANRTTFCYEPQSYPAIIYFMFDRGYTRSGNITNIVYDIAYIEEYMQECDESKDCEIKDDGWNDVELLLPIVHNTNDNVQVKLSDGTTGYAWYSEGSWYLYDKALMRYTRISDTDVKVTHWRRA